MSVPRVLNDRYEIGDLLGRGGMADVYKAHDIRLGRTVAIKLLRADVARDSHLQARFRREAQAVAGLNFPSIVAVYDTGEHISGDPGRDYAHLPYIVMEYVHGKTLRELIRAKSISTEQAIEYSMGVLAALDYSHRAGIVHRDIKPANVMVTEDADGVLSQIKVMDFGIARSIADSAATMTQTQTVMGTAQYLSPEQARGESVDARSDLYSAACLLYEMLAGRPPFVGDSPVSVAYQHVRELPPPPSTFNPTLDPALDSLLLRALQKDRNHRFQDALSFRRAVRAAGVGIAPSAGGARDAEQDVDATTLVPVTAAASPLTGTPIPDGGPATRAMAKVMAGGALTTEDSYDHREQPGEVLPAVKRRRRAWMTTLFVLVGLILGGGALIAYNLMNAPAEVVQSEPVPEVAGLAHQLALTRLEAAGLLHSSTEEFSETVAEGMVIRSDPPSGSPAERGTTVHLFVSKGSSEVLIPANLAGRTEAEVRQDLLDLGLLISSPNSMVNDGNVPANRVVSTDPAPGEKVAVGTSVTLRISTGQVEMPSLFDLTEDPSQVKQTVTAALKELSPSLSVTFEETENSVVAPGTVTAQSIPAGSAVPQGSTVVVTLAKAPPVSTVSPTPNEEDNESPASNPSEEKSKNQGNNSAKNQPAQNPGRNKD
ncbi:Stk1 family PASTA domain-containing Ser/Thr kinase [Specibacter sp. NPDC057265]|uniref:Stk1 family PASTA domain-containing Ser/Thr kinase n=1 Tax=Specibacter sp. NPDC057265 TaxID=3346075 RepID=UPI00363CE95C